MEETNRGQVPWVHSSPMRPIYSAGGRPYEVPRISSFSQDYNSGTNTGRLNVRTKPTSARVRILNINPVYYSGMELDAGRYHVEVTASGYIRQKRWIQLAAGEELQLDFSLSRKQAEVTSSKIRAASTRKIYHDPKTGVEFTLVDDN